jgi:hypothetical protein
MEKARILKTEVNAKTRQATITVKCPYCHQRHIHGLGKLPDTIKIKDLINEDTTKMSHCLGESKTYLIKVNDG